jgi:hypothetical protein
MDYSGRKMDEQQAIRCLKGGDIAGLEKKHLWVLQIPDCS